MWLWGRLIEREEQVKWCGLMPQRTRGKKNIDYLVTNTLLKKHWGNNHHLDIQNQHFRSRRETISNIHEPTNWNVHKSVWLIVSYFVSNSRFLDSRTFASCSDDTTVRLWDVRSLKYNVRTLHGHSNWVKNVEYASSLGLLVTSGFDGSIYTWDINR